MTIIQRLKALGLAAAAATLISGAAMAQETIKIGMVNLSLCCAYFVGMDAAVKDAAKAYSNVEVLSTDANGDVEKLTSDIDSDVETLGTLVDQIAEYLRQRPLSQAPYAGWVSTGNEPVYSPEHLLEQRVFTSVLTVTYRAIK